MITEMKIRSFLAVVQTGKFTEAGNLLYISQQAVSKNVSDLERDVGVQLLRRDHNKISLTEEGEKLRLFFEETSLIYSALLSDIHAHTSNRALLDINIGYQDMIDFGSAPVRAFKRLKKIWPGIMLIGEYGKPDGLVRKLVNNSLDVILINKRFLPRKHAELNVKPLFQTTMVVGAAADYFTKTDAETWRAFSEEPLLIDAIEGETEDAAIRRVSSEIRKFGFRPKEVIVQPNRETIYSEAEMGKGVFFASGIALIPNSSRLKIYPTDIKEDTCCAWRKAGRNDKASRFIQFLSDEYEKDKIG
jgi:DNA-binding transcriptional LysR family regulator